MSQPLGEKVRKLREAKGLTQKQLSDLSQITQATVSRLESCDIKMLEGEKLRRLAIALNVTVDFLVSKTDRLTPDDRVSSDPMAAHIFNIYEKLPEVERNLLEKFAIFLEQQYTDR
jgi:transcriptional regulator with XRE-family HTH domain